MNVERMLYLAEQLENPTDPKLKDVSFDMNFFIGLNYKTGCGTVACIGGHACRLFGQYTSGPEAVEVLDLTRDQEMKLFFNKGSYVSPSDNLSLITRQEAVEAILRMVNEHIDATLAKMCESALGGEHQVEESPVEVLRA